MWAINVNLGNYQHVGNNQNHRKGEFLYGGVIRWDKMRTGERHTHPPAQLLLQCSGTGSHWLARTDFSQLSVQ